MYADAVWDIATNTMVSKELTVVEERMTGEHMLYLGSRTGSALDYKYRMNLDGR